MKQLLDSIMQKETSFKESDVFFSEDIHSISMFDHEYKNLKKEDIDICLNIVKKPDFNIFKERFCVELHEDMKDFWSQYWCPSFSVLNKKAITNNHSDNFVYVNLLSSPSMLELTIEDIELYSEEMNEENDSFDGAIFLPIAFKTDGWVILFNNNNGSIYIQEHDPCGYIKIADSIKDFFEE